tara:strand:+ start:103 stop:216 length:114 start_codon:yes stop_codon:yes gene_type:complete
MKVDRAWLGGHTFATNLKDHNKNIAKCRAIEAERKKS